MTLQDIDLDTAGAPSLIDFGVHGIIESSVDSMVMRLVGGNEANPTLINEKISAHDFIAALQVWNNTDISKAELVAAFNLTHPNDDGDLTAIKGWYNAAEANSPSLGARFVNELEWRIILARDKSTPSGGVDLNGKFGFAVKGTLINGADGTHSLENTGTLAHQFSSWAAP